MAYWTVNKWGLPNTKQAQPGPGQLASGGSTALPPVEVMDSLNELEELMNAKLSALASFNEDGKMVLLRHCRKEEAAAVSAGQPGPPGLLNQQQFRHMWRSLGVRMSREQAAGMFLRYGCDAQGLLPYDVFAAELQGSPARLLALEPHQKGPYRSKAGDASFKGKITYRYCRKPVFPPSNWDGSLVYQSAKLPKATLALEWVHGYNGSCTASNAFYTSEGKVVYFVAALGVVYDPAAHTQQFFQGHDDDITCMASHPDRKLVATGQVASALDGTADCPFLHVWDTTSSPFESLQRIDFPAERDASSRYIVAMSFSPCGERLIVVTGDNRHTVGVYDWKSKQLLHQGVGHNGQPPQVYGVACNPFAPLQDTAGNSLPSPAMFVTYGVKHIKFWVGTVDESGRQGYSTSQGKFKAAPKADVTSAVFLPSGWLVTGTPAGELLLWDATPSRPAFGCCCQVVTAHSPGVKMASVHDGQPVLQGVRCLALRRHYTELVSAGADDKICFWDIAGGKVGKLLQTYQFQDPAETSLASFRALDLHPQGDQLLLGTSNCDLWQVTPTQQAGQTTSATAACRDNTSSSDDAAGHFAETSRASALPEALIQGHTGDVYGIAYHPTKPHIFVTACESNHIFVWHARRKQLMAKVSVGLSAHSVDFSPDASHLAVGGVDGAMRVLLVEEMTTAVAQMHHCKEAIDDLKYSPDGSKLAAGSHDNFIDIFDVHKGYQRVARCCGHSSYIRHIDWAANSKVLQSSCGAYELLYFDANTGKQVQQNQRDTAWSTYTNILGFGVMGIWPDGSDGTDVNAVCRSHSLAQWENHDPLVAGGVGQLLVTAGDDGRVRLLSYPCVVEDAPARVYHGHSSHVMNTRFSPHNKWVCTVGGRDRAVFQWRVQPEKKQKEAPQMLPSPVVVTYPVRPRQQVQHVPRKVVQESPPAPKQVSTGPVIAWDADDIQSVVTQPALSPPQQQQKQPPKQTSGPPQIPLCRYRIHVFTSDIRGAGTDANVSIRLIGTSSKESGLHRLENSKNNFERGSEDIFFLQLADLGDLAYVEIGHDNSGFASGWHLEQVVVVHETSNHRWTFACDRWLDKSEDDGLIWRRLLPSGLSDSTSYRVITYTSDCRGAGTDAGVYIELIGDIDGKAVQGPRLLLDNSANNFERAAVDSFLLKKHKKLGRLTAIRIGHDNKGMCAGWHLDHVEVCDDSDGTTYFFPCKQWLDKSEGDGAIERVLQAASKDELSAESKLPYRVTVYTSDVKFAGTDANVFIQIMGEINGVTISSGKLPLNNSKKNFERGAIDMFTLQLTNLGVIKRIHIGHDNSGAGAAWHLDKVEVVCLATGQVANFSYRGWLSKTEPPYRTEVELLPMADAGMEALHRYSIIVYTSDIRGAGTDAGVSCVIHGDKGCTPQLTLENSANNFERGAKDAFSVQSVDVGQMQRLQISHDNRGAAPAWHLQHVEVINNSTAARALFYANLWLDTKLGTSTVTLTAAAADMVPLQNKWKISVQTRDIRGAGTDADISVVLVGSKATSKQLKLDSSADNYERGKLDEFVIDLGNVDIGQELTKLDIGFANQQSTAGRLGCLLGQQWGLGTVEVQHLATGSRQVFVYDDWISKSQPRVQLMPGVAVDKVLVEYKVLVYTSDVRGAGTDAAVSIELHGTKDHTTALRLENAANNFERGRLDTFILTALDVGQLTHVVVVKDAGGLGGDWHLQMIEVVHTGTHHRLQFPYNGWLQGKQVVELKVGAAAAETGRCSYRVEVTTSDVRGAGTDANVVIVLYGDKGDTGPQPLESSANDFERGKTDTFFLNSPDIGTLQSIRISHDNSGLGSAWHLSSIRVTNTKSGDTVTFPYNQWLDEKHGLSVVLWPDRDGDGLADQPGSEQSNHSQQHADVCYKVIVYTSDIRGAGTDANVYIELKGTKGVLGAMRLDNAADNFERAKRDEFVVHGCDVGDLCELTVWHDNRGLAAAWHLQQIEVVHSLQLKTYLFPCNDWLQKKEQKEQAATNAAVQAAKAVGAEPGCLAVLLPAGPNAAAAGTAISSKAAGKVVYKVEVQTSDIRGAGTDADVVMTLYGTAGDSGPLSLFTSSNDFERGQLDTFFVQAPDVGALSGIQLECKGGGLTAAWHLDSVTVTNSNTGEVAKCAYNDWFDSKKGWKQVLQPSTSAAPAQDPLQPANDAVLAAPANRTQQSSHPAEPTSTAAPVVEYQVSVFTGDVVGAGTDGDVYLALKGDKGVLRERQLKDSSTGGNMFERGKQDIFKFQGSCVGELTCASVRLVERGLGAAWYLSHIEVLNTSRGSRTVFVHNGWLQQTKANPLGQIEIPAVKSSKDMLPQSTAEAAYGLSISQPATTPGDTASAPAAVAPGQITEVSTGATVAAEQPPGATAGTEGPQQIGPCVYKILTQTSNISGAGTDASVTIKVVGPLGVLMGGPINLHNGSNCFEQGQLDHFLVEVPAGQDCGSPIIQITVERSSSITFGADWHLDHIVVMDESRGHTYKWLCRSWFNSTEGLIQTWGLPNPVSTSGTAKPQKPQRQLQLVEAPAVVAQQLHFKALQPSTAVAGGAAANAGAQAPALQSFLSQLGDVFKISFLTSDKLRAGAPGCVRLQLHDCTASAWEPVLTQQSKQFDRGALADFFPQCMQQLQLGDIVSVTVWHEGGGAGSSWHLQEITIQHLATTQVWRCSVNAWVPKTQDPQKGLALQLAEVRQHAVEEDAESQQQGSSRVQQDQDSSALALDDTQRYDAQSCTNLQLHEQQPETIGDPQPPPTLGAASEQEPTCCWRLCHAPHPEDANYCIQYYHNSSTGVSQYEVPAEYTAWEAAHSDWLQRQ